MSPDQDQAGEETKVHLQMALVQVMRNPRSAKRPGVDLEIHTSEAFQCRGREKRVDLRHKDIVVLKYMALNSS